MISLNTPKDWAFDKPHPNTPLAKILDSPQGTPLFLLRKQADFNKQPLVSFERHFNPDLTIDSTYFRSLNDALKCVNKNAGKELTREQENKVCAKEFKNLRLQAFGE